MVQGRKTDNQARVEDSRQKVIIQWNRVVASKTIPVLYITLQKSNLGVSKVPYYGIIITFISVQF